MMSRPPIWDISEASVLAGCDRCAWRTVQPSALAATRAWASHWREEHGRGQALGLRSRAKPRATSCRVCGARAEDGVSIEPFAALCPPCRRARRAAEARRKYAACCGRGRRAGGGEERAA